MVTSKLLENMLVCSFNMVSPYEVMTLGLLALTKAWSLPTELTHRKQKSLFLALWSYHGWISFCSCLSACQLVKSLSIFIAFWVEPLSIFYFILIWILTAWRAFKFAVFNFYLPGSTILKMVLSIIQNYFSERRHKHWKGRLFPNLFCF